MTVTLHVPDGLLDKAGLGERQLKIELACALFAQGLLELWPAAQVAGLSRVEMEEELLKRDIPLYDIDKAYWEEEKKGLDAMRQQWPSS